MALSHLRQEFILHFGEMGSRWGINRTVGQIYALLYLSERPLCADDIVAALGVSRSNVSMGLKELQGWNLVLLRHIPGDRRDHFTTLDDLWQMLRTLVAERRKREIDPTLTKLRDLELLADTAPEDAVARARITEMRELIELLTGWHDDMARLETERLVALLKMGARLQKFISGPADVLSLGRVRQKGDTDGRA
ncbi:transcriptional regulator [Meridianimarinicoccus roseus]|uniref:HTH-type transcriptional regulator n=1 Tax=Meridianimarinicoccus roseus TaxID=2072018 RepID=A0A2V2LI17_9RHOB|nr:GbsR/MarR family transcriptional regulator [Meridianimarinicoccus roseus]PWR03651.1 transcriptional regulator [Meridianimarinicoccus roseus]